MDLNMLIRSLCLQLMWCESFDRMKKKRRLLPSSSIIDHSKTLCFCFSQCYFSNSKRKLFQDFKTFQLRKPETDYFSRFQLLLLLSKYKQKEKHNSLEWTYDSKAFSTFFDDEAGPLVASLPPYCILFSLTAFYFSYCSIEKRDFKINDVHLQNLNKMGQCYAPYFFSLK